MASLHSELGIIYLLQSEQEKARASQKRVVAARENKLGARHPMVALALMDLAVDLIRIPSVTGEEDAAVARVADWLQAMPVEVDYWHEGVVKRVADPAYPGHEVERAVPRIGANSDRIVASK